MKKIRVVTGGRGRPALVQEIKPTLEEFQRLVEGDIEYISDGEGLAAYVNEAGRMKYLTESSIVLWGIPLVGPVLIFKSNRASDTEGSLDDATAEALRILMARWS